MNDVHVIRKYPRTHHVEGSPLQPSDHDLSSISLAALAGRHLVVEERVDGASSGISYDRDGRLYLQSRGHFLDGGPRERHFALFTTWANRWRSELWNVLGSRYVLYGEWLSAKHTIFNAALAHYFLEFDVLDVELNAFLSTPRRRELLADLPLRSVPLVWEGNGDSFSDPGALVRTSAFKTDAWRRNLEASATAHGVSIDRVLTETDASALIEGLYIKVEEYDGVQERYKFIRPSFLTAVLESGSHWLDRPILPNALALGVDLFDR